MISKETNQQILNRLLDDYGSKKIKIYICTEQRYAGDKFELPIEINYGEPHGFQLLTLDQLLNILSTSRETIKLSIDDL